VAFHSRFMGVPSRPGPSVVPLIELLEFIERQSKHCGAFELFAGVFEYVAQLLFWNIIGDFYGSRIRGLGQASIWQSEIVTDVRMIIQGRRQTRVGDLAHRAPRAHGS
jgi:hypothetical protein